MATVASVYPLRELERQHMLTDAFSGLAGRDALTDMKLRRTISTHLEQSDEGFDLRAAINAIVAVNVDEREGADSPRADGDKEESHPIKEAK